MIDCETALRQLWDYLDGELTAERMDAVRAHLKACDLCYPHYDFERTFLEMVGTLKTEHADPDALKERVLAALQAEGLTP